MLKFEKNAIKHLIIFIIIFFHKNNKIKFVIIKNTVI